MTPPYNENKSKGKYKDQWVGESTDYSWAGKSHGAYLDFLFPRLSLAADVLSDEGCLMLFIGDQGYPYIRVLCDNIFGGENYVGTVNWESSSNDQKSKKINRTHEYVLVYAKNIKMFPGLYKFRDSAKKELEKLAYQLKEEGKTFSEAEEKYKTEYNRLLKAFKDDTESGPGLFKYIDPISFIPFQSGDTSDPRSGNKTKLKHPITGKECPLPGKGKGWRYGKEYLDFVTEQMKDPSNIFKLHTGHFLVVAAHPSVESQAGLIFSKDHSVVPRAAKYYSAIETEKEVLMTSGKHNYMDGDKKIGIDPSTGFETVKPAEFLKELILNYPKSTARVLDFFAGSGTTAIATELANEKDKGLRQWVLVEQNKTTLENVLVPRLDFFRDSVNGQYQYDMAEITFKKVGRAGLVKSFFRFIKEETALSEGLTLRDLDANSDIFPGFLGKQDLSKSQRNIFLITPEIIERAKYPSRYKKALLSKFGKDIKNRFYIAHDDYEVALQWGEALLELTGSSGEIKHLPKEIIERWVMILNAHSEVKNLSFLGEE